MMCQRTLISCNKCPAVVRDVEGKASWYVWGGGVCGNSLFDVFLISLAGNLGFPGGARGKESTCRWRRHKRCGFDPPGVRHGSPLQNSCLENSMGLGAWQARVHGAAKSWTRQSDRVQHI